ncbi:hypothetical protein PGSY75_0104600 [Plasmodium gaboni]|uniref:RAP domain-containing protein n=1 Tax=Plasmodium gaboni TaxID=647221 RepID=A0A151LX25_9APIC|nr:hypothetical protein PGSY75_0104600 [Plasmodium gaboni]KYO03692.1 hypothetical protein PGSY75_0104600 [Plasmodium gaboni]
MIIIKCLGNFRNINKVSLSFYSTQYIKPFPFFSYYHINNKKKKEKPIYATLISNKISHFTTYNENIRIKKKKKKEKNHIYVTKKKCDIQNNDIIYHSDNFDEVDKYNINNEINENRIKSDIINLINNIKNINNIQNGHINVNINVINELMNIILHVNYNINCFFNLKKKYVIGFLWSMVKCINIIEHEKLFDQNIITHLKYFFIFLSNKVIQKNLLESLYHPVDIKQFIFSFLNIKLNENNIKAIDSIKIHDLDNFIKYLKCYPYEVKLSHKSETKEKIETNIFYQENNEKQKIKNNKKENNNNQNEHGNHISDQIQNKYLPLLQECIDINLVIHSIYSYICDKIKIINMEIKTVIDFLELANKNSKNGVSSNISNILLYKIQHKNNYNNNYYNNNDNIYYHNNNDNICHHNNSTVSIYNFSVFQVCRFINIIINYNIKQTNKFISSIINILSYEQYYPTKDKINYYNFNQYLSHNVYNENVDIQNDNIIHVSAPKHLCNKWLYKATPRDIASLIRDISRLNFMNYHFYNILIEAFFIKTDPNKNGYTTYGNRNNNTSKNNEAKIKDNINININNNNNSNNNNHYYYGSKTICRKNNNTTHFSSQSNQNLQLEDIRNYVDILTALSNINYTHNKYINFFINKIIKDEKNSVLFFNKKNIQNVVITLRNLLLLIYKENDIINKMIHFIVTNNNHINIKQLIMIYYSLYNYINKIFHMENIKYVGNPSQIFFNISDEKNNITHNNITYNNTTNNYNKLHIHHDDVMSNNKYNAMKEKEHNFSYISIEYIKQYIHHYMFKIFHIIFIKKEHIDSLQGLVNFYYATSYSINNLSLQMYQFFYEHFSYILDTKKKGKENIILETILQIFLFHYKNNIVHKKFLISLLNFMNANILVDLDNLYTITSIAHHFNIINEDFLNTNINFINKEINKIENIKGPTPTDDNISININKTKKEKNYIYYNNDENKEHIDISHSDKQDDIYKYNQLDNTNINNIKNVNVYKKNMINDNNEKYYTNKVMKCIFFLITNNTFLNTSIRNFIKILVLLKKMFKKKTHFNDEEYKITQQIFLSLNIYCKRKENVKKYMNHKINSRNNHDIHFYIRHHFFIPYTILKNIVKRNIVSHKKVHISSFQYKLSDYFNKKKIMYRSEYYLKHGLIVDFLILKNNKPFLLLEIDGIYHFNISTDVGDYDIIHNNMLLLKNGKTLFRNNILESFDHLKFLSIPWYFFLQTQWIKKLDILLNENGLF